MAPAWHRCVGGALGLALTGWAAGRLGGSTLPWFWPCCSPLFFLLTYGTLMSHTSDFLAASPCWPPTCCGGRRDSTVGLCFRPGLGLALNNRTYTAALIALPFAVDSLWHLWQSRKDRTAWMGTIAFAGAACLGVGGLLLYNYLTLGDALSMTYLYYDPSDKLGFGWRHNHPVFPAPLPVEHSFSRGLSILQDNLLLLDRWLFGFPGGLVVWIGLTAYGWSRRWSPLLIGSAVSVWIGYLLFWYPGYNETGPVYFMETLPAMLLAASLGVQRLLQKPIAPRRRTSAIAALLMVWCTASLLFTWQTASVLREDRAGLAEAEQTLREAPANSLILIRPNASSPGWKQDLIHNPMGLDGNPIVARWFDSSKDSLIRQFPGHQAWLFSLTDEGSILLPIYAEPLQHSFTIGNLHRLTGTNLPHPNHGNRLVRTAIEGDHEAGLLVLGRSIEAYPGTFIAEFELSIRGLESDSHSVTLDIATDDGATILGHKTLLGPIDRTLQQVIINLDEPRMLEPRVHYNGIGDVRIYAVRLYEAVEG
ncbi:MAG: hypothetical protein H7A43_07795 [Verrucomicrobia bacterium]|nr:hypothetical protein [Verrucomicrobiota bacterium]